MIYFEFAASYFYQFNIINLNLKAFDFTYEFHLEYFFALEFNVFDYT
jgi:hypothetical protein